MRCQVKSCFYEFIVFVFSFLKLVFSFLRNIFDFFWQSITQNCRLGNKFVTVMFKHCGPHRIFQVEVKARLAMIMRDSYRSVYA